MELKFTIEESWIQFYPGSGVTQVNPNVLRFLACPWVTVGTGKLQICVGIGRNHRTAPGPRSKAIKTIFVAFISIFESKHAENDKIRVLSFKTF